MALKLGRESRFESIRLAHFEGLAEKVGVPKQRVVDVVRRTIAEAMDTWPKAEEAEGARSGHLRAHVARLPLIGDAG